jgi:branched-chain amino acid transport system permease protein/urea transport system permease protein
MGKGGRTILETLLREDSLAAGTGIILLTLPFFFEPLILDEITLFLIYGIFALSVDLIWGYIGIISFGQAAFFGAGAYVMTWITKGMFFTVPFPEVVGLLLGIIVPGLFAMAIGYFLFYGKIGGVYFSIIMLAVSSIMEATALGLLVPFGAWNGLFDIPSLGIEIGSFSWSTTGGLSYFYVAMAFAAIAYMICRKMINSPLGTVMAAIHNNEDRAESFGFNIAKYKILIFGASGALAGMAGAIYAPHAGFVSFNLFGVLFSTEVLIWVAVGGRGTLIGAFLGTIIVKGLSYFLSDVAVLYWMLILGAIFVAIVSFFPSGLIGTVNELLSLRSDKG